jgi:predicted transcriptional regulator
LCGDTIKPMADFKSKPGSFLPFLEDSQRKEPSAPASPLTLLEILARQTQESLPLFDLQTRGNMDPSRYAEALKSLRNAGYIAIEGEAPEQVVRLTGTGADVVRIARPA